MAFSLPFELPQFGFYDFFVGIALFCAFVVVLMLGFLARGAIKWAIFVLCVLLFFALPFFNILIVDNFVNKAVFSDSGSKKLVYIDSFLLQGTLQNQGKKPLKKCDFNIYVKSRYPLKPDYKVIFSDLNLGVGQSIEIEKSIENFKSEGIKTIKTRFKPRKSRFKTHFNPQISRFHLRKL